METVADKLLEMAETETEKRLLRRWLELPEEASRAAAWQALAHRELPRPRRYCW